MSSRERPADIGNRRARSALRDLGEELRNARIDSGLSQAAVAIAAGITRTQVGRIERADVPRVSVLILARLLAVVGLELSARAYPAGSPMRDHAQLALLARFRERLGTSVRTHVEVPLPIPGDGRAWDLLLGVGPVNVAVEAETRPRDVQALLRRIAAKRRDDPRATHVVLLLADTRHNRTLVRDYGATLMTAFPERGPDLLSALVDGRDPGGSGIVLM